ncbi:hypothetical protein IWQ49_006416 [Labrenzia sp. EL_126]|nr:hypothetical protein [Labrenzia sp. EL_126]
MTDQFDYWRKALAGQNPPIHEGEAQVGFYRKRNKPYKGKPMADEPVAIYWHGDKLIAVQGTEKRSKQVDPNDLWTWVADKPISYEEYLEAFHKGKWEKAVEGLQDERGVGDNNPPADPFEAFNAELQSVLKMAEEAMSEDIKTKEDADRFVNIKDRLLQLGKDGEEKRKAEKKPHDDAGKAVQKKWSPALGDVDTTKKKLVGRINDWIRAEEQRIAKEQLAAAKAAEEAGEELPVQSASPVQIGGAVSGRKTSMRSRKGAVITDPVALAKFLLSGDVPNPDLMAALQKCANKIVANGAEAPGIDQESKRSAA